MKKTKLTEQEKERFDVFQKYFDLFIYPKIETKVKVLQSKNLLDEVVQKWSSLLSFSDRALFLKIQAINEEELLELNDISDVLPF